MRTLRLAPLLLRGRVRAGHGLIDLMSVAAFTLSGWLLLVVTAGVNAFWNRQLTPPAAFLALFGSHGADNASQLVLWTILAACAGVLLIVPLLWSLIGGSAAFLLRIPQDWMLLLSGVVVAAMLLLDRRRRNRSEASATTQS